MSKFASTFTAITLTVAAIGTAQAQAQEGNWLVRVRAVNLDSANGNDAQLSTTLKALNVGAASVNNKVIPELDISYFFSPNLAAELILTYPQKHDLKLGGTKVATFKHLPPTLSLQYHFAPKDTFRPYVGLGVNYTNISDVHFDASLDALKLNLKRNSYGLSFQVGFDVAIGNNLYLNVDLKKVQIGTTVLSADQGVGKFKVDPLLLGVGLGMRF